jgi:exodeoxyribonuclease-5
MKLNMNEDQVSAIALMQEFLESDEHFFLLKGPAGTGKTTLVKSFAIASEARLCFCAPTNKATKVLKESLTDDNYNPACMTIYSLLKLRIGTNGEIKELIEPEEAVDISKYDAVVLDEGSMISKAIWPFITRTAKEQKVKFIFLGDRAQLPPVKEKFSLVWELPVNAELTKVVRHDNAILKFATKLRNLVDHPAPSIKIESDHDVEEGVWALSKEDFRSSILSHAQAFREHRRAKVIAWRNKVVDEYNELIRNCLFDNPEIKYLPTDRVVVTEPVHPIDGDDKRTIASVDDEGEITKTSVVKHPKHREFSCWLLDIRLDDNRLIQVYVLHEDSQKAFDRAVEEKAAAAKVTPRLWKDFWAFKGQFHQIRHAYAITAHRSQGSTYEWVWCDWKDILSNRDRAEGFRCLYVAATRPKKKLFLG